MCNKYSNVVNIDQQVKDVEDPEAWRLVHLQGNHLRSVKGTTFWCDFI